MIPVMVWYFVSYPIAFPSGAAVFVSILGCFEGFAGVVYRPFSATVAASSGFSKD